MYGLQADSHASQTAQDNGQLHAEILAGLQGEAKYINPKFFYDEYGSRLFEKITQLPEYYPTRTELSLLEKYKHEIAAAIGQGHVLIEPGAGSCSKVRILLPTLAPASFVPIDISREFLFAAAEKLRTEYPDIQILPIFLLK